MSVRDYDQWAVGVVWYALTTRPSVSIAKHAKELGMTKGQLSGLITRVWTTRPASPGLTLKKFSWE